MYASLDPVYAFPYVYYTPNNTLIESYRAKYYAKHDALIHTRTSAHTRPSTSCDSTSRSSPSSTSKPYYPLAFTLLTHGDFDGLVTLVSTLLTPETFILIHIDGKHMDMYEKVRVWLESEYVDPVTGTKGEAPPNLSLIPESLIHKVIWGDISITWAQLNCYFWLQDIIEYDHVLNLSGEIACVVMLCDMLSCLICLLCYVARVLLHTCHVCHVCCAVCEFSAIMFMSFSRVSSLCCQHARMNGCIMYGHFMFVCDLWCCHGM